MSITQNLEELLAVVPDAMVIVDKEGTIEVVNQHTEKLFGYNKEELIGQKIEVLIPERYKHHHDQHRNHYFSNPHVRPMGSGLKLYGLRKDGTEFGIEISLSPFQNRQYVCATIRDVSERFKYLEKFENLLESAPDAMVIVNKQGDIVLVNRQTEKLFGYSREELIGNKVEILIPTRYLGNHSSHRDKYFHNPHVRPMGSGLKLFAKRKDLSEFSVEISLSPIEPEGLVSATVRDVTERVLLTEFLISQNKQLEDFAYITSHNLRGPVSNLTSLLQFIREEDTKEGKDLLLGKLEKTVFNLEDTLNQLMEVLRIRKDSAKEKEVIHFEVIYQKVRASFEGQIKEFDVDIKADFTKAPSIEYSSIYLESILQNLISNAIKYRSPERNCKIFVHSYKENGNIKLKVEDNSLGIDMQTYGDKIFGLHKIFHKHPDAKGVGLFITKAQIEAMGGEIKLESAVNVGSTFIITFNLGQKNYEKN